MNLPGAADGNWAWRLDGAALMPDLPPRLQELAKTYGR